MGWTRLSSAKICFRFLLLLNSLEKVSLLSKLGNFFFRLFSVWFMFLLVLPSILVHPFIKFSPFSLGLLLFLLFNPFLVPSITFLLFKPESFLLSHFFLMILCLSLVMDYCQSCLKVPL